MSLFDPLEDKKKKFNIFDYASTIVPTQTPVNQYQTPMNAAPADQYMTPMTPVKPLPVQKIYNPVKDYTEGYASKQAQNIFNTPEMIEEVKDKDVFRFERNKQYDDLLDSSTRDLFNGMPITEVTNYYPEIKQEHTNAIIGLVEDIKRGMPKDKVSELYPDLPISFRTRIVNNRDFSKIRMQNDPTLSKASTFNYPNVITPETIQDARLWKQLLGLQKISPKAYAEMTGSPEGLSRLGALLSNLPSIPTTILSFAGNLLTQPVKTIADMVVGLNEAALDARDTLDDEGIAGLQTITTELADFVATNPDVIFGPKLMKGGEAGLIKGVKKVGGSVGPTLLKGAARASENVPGSTVGDVAQTYIYKTAKSNLLKKGKELTPDNFMEEFQVMKDSINKGKKYDFATDMGTEQQGSNIPTKDSVSKAESFVKTYVSELDPDLQKGIRTNPYIKEYWTKTMETIDREGVPSDLKQLMREPLQEVGTELLNKISQEENRISYSGPLYNIIRENKTPISIETAQQNIPSLLKSKDITIIDGTIDFNRSAISNTADMTAIQKIYNRIMESKQINGAELLNLRRFSDDLAKRDKGVSGDGAYIIREMRKLVDNVAKENMTGLKELDEKYRQQLKDIKEIKQGLFYKEAARRGEVKDNFMSILKNIGGENRARMRETLSRIIPDLDTRVEAINIIPRLSKAYSTKSGITKKLISAGAGGVIGYSLGGTALGAIIGSYVAEALGNKIFTGMKKKAIRNIVDKITPEGKAKLKEINDKIKQGEELLKQEQEFIDKLRDKIIRANIVNLRQLGYNPNVKSPIIRVGKVTESFADNYKKTNEYFLKIKKSGTELTDSNERKKGDVSEFGTLDTGIVMDGKNRTVMIEGKKYQESDVKPVYRDTEVTDFANDMSTTTKEQPKDTSIDPKDFGMRKQQYLSDGLQLMEVKSLNDLPKEFQDRLLEIANQGAKGDMVKLSDKIDKLMEDYNNYKNPPKKELITKKEEEFKPTMKWLKENGEEMNLAEAKGEFNMGRSVRPILNDGFTEYPLGDVITSIDDMIYSEYMVYDIPKSSPGKKTNKEYNTPEKTNPIQLTKESELLDKRDSLTPENQDLKHNVYYGNKQYVDPLGRQEFIKLATVKKLYPQIPTSEIIEAYKNKTQQELLQKYSTEKKALITKKSTDDGSKLQTEGGRSVGSSDEIRQISIPKNEISVEPTMQGTDNGTEQERLRGYLSNDASNGDGSGTGLPVSKSKQSEINQEVIKILEDKQFSKKPEDYTKEEIQKLLKYEGGGGLLKKEGDFSGSNDEFYTPKEVVDTMRYLTKKHGYTEGATILEPSIGIGRFLRTKPMRTGNATGYEIDKVSGTIAAVTNPQALIKIGDYQDQFMDFTGTRPLTAAELANKPKYDVVIGNPPYKLRDTKQRRLGDLKDVNRFEDYFMIRGLQSLNNGGVMVVVVPSSFLDKPHYPAKQMMQDLGIKLEDAYRLPNKTFPNTDVGTDIIVFRKVGSQLESETMVQFQYMSNGQRFNKNPSKVMGEIAERTNRFGKLENYVKGDNTAVLKIIKDGISETVTKASDLIEQNNISEKKSLITKKTTAVEPTTTKEISQAKPIKKKPSQPVSGGLFNIPTEKEIKVISDKIVNPVIQPQPEGISNRIFNQDNVNPEQLQNILKYQNMTNVFDEVEGIMYQENPQLLNYMEGKTFLNYNYFAGDIYAKLDQLEMDKDKINENQYQKQRQGLLAILPKQQVIEDMHFNPLDNELMAMDTGEIYSKGEYVYDNVTKRGNMVYKDVPMPIRYKFTELLKQELVPSKARVYAGEIINYFEGGRVEKERAGIIQEDAIYYFNKFIKEAITAELQEKIVDGHNRRNRSVVPVDVSQIPFVIKDISKNFRGKPLVFKEVQIESALKAAMKGTFISALGVGYGKTMVGILAMMKNMQKGQTKRPLIVVPGQTMVGWIETIKGLFPTYKINNFGTLDTKRRSKLNKELGSDKSKRIDDNTITIITHSAFENQIAFKKATQDKITAEFFDDMKTEDMTDKAKEALNESNEAIVGSAGTTKAKKGGDFSMYDSEFLSEQFNKVEILNREEFVKSFIEADTTKNPLSKMKAEEMYAMKPMFMEDFGFDSILVDEIHNFKNVFSKAKIDEGDKNMYGNVVGSTSKRGMKMAIATNYILSNNNGRGVLGLTATPFNNQAIEVYNLLNFVGRARLKKLGITNMNDFMTKFSNFTESLVVKPSGTDVAYRMIQKNFVNLQDLQRLISEFIDYKGDSPEIIKPELITKVVKLQFSELQKQIQEEIEMRIDENAELGDVIGGQQEARANVVSPYFTRRAGSLPTPQEILKNSPKLDFFADLIIEKNKLGNKDGAIMFLPMGTALHEIIREGISLKTGVPINKIGIINGTPKFKSKMVETAEKFNKGEYEILIGGENINEGIDLQHKTYIMYDTLLGWNPTVTTQKNGRGRRQGNLRNYVVSVLPLMENSVDSVMLQKKEEKQSRINDIFSAEGEVFSTEDIDPTEEKLALMTNPIKKAKIAINIEMKKINRSIEIIKGDIAELERHKSNLVQEVDLLPKLYENISRYSTNDGMSEYVKRQKKEIESLEGKIKRSKEKIQKYNINIEADLAVKTMELEALQAEIKSIESTMESRIQKYRLEQEQEAMSRKDVQHYLNQINDITKELKVFENVEQQAEFKKSLLSKK